MKIALTALFACASLFAQKVIPLYDGPAPGSETWNYPEKDFFSQLWQTQVVTNVAKPTLTYFAADKAAANGTAVVICPGGGFHALSINSEGNDVAKWLAARGVASFVLKYRLVRTGEDGTVEVMSKMANRAKLDADNAAVVPLAIADGKAAVAYVRSHAAEWGVDPARVGIMGFSAGGTVTSGVAFGYTPENRPAFVAPIYAYAGALKSMTVPADAPPAFIVAATDDQLGLAPDSVQLYGLWMAARKPVELHMYAKGGHGFGMRRQNLPSDRWIERFADWLTQQGFMKK